MRNINLLLLFNILFLPVIEYSSICGKRPTDVSSVVTCCQEVRIAGGKVDRVAAAHCQPNDLNMERISRARHMLDFIGYAFC